MKLPTLHELQEELEEGLAGAICASSPTSMTREAARQAAAAVLERRGLPEEVVRIFGDRPVCTLVGFDANHIQRWVFDSERVQVAAGASRTLDHLNDLASDVRGRIPGVTGTLYSAGGGGILFASAAIAKEAVVADTRRWIEKRSRELSFTVVAEDLFAADLEPGREPRPVEVMGVHGVDRFQVVSGVQGALVRTQILMRRAKDSRLRFEPRPPLTDRNELLAPRCPSCGRRDPAKTPVVDRGPEYWCGWCRGLRRWIRNPRSRAPLLCPGIPHRSEEKRQRPFERDDEPITFAGLAESVNSPRQYLGFIALDGNAMGSVVQGMRTFLQLRAFSEATSAIYGVARCRALEVLAPHLEDDWHPEDAALSLLSGGDEITLVLSASAAPQVAAATLRAVEEGFEELTSSGGLLHTAFRDAPDLLEALRSAGSGAGVVTAHSNYPVRLLRNYAYQLQKQAKRACAERGYRSAIAWRLLTDSSPLTDRLEPEASQEMDLAAFEALLAAARSARELSVPAAAFQGLLSQYRAEERSLRSLAGEQKQRFLDLVAANFFRYQLARNPELEAWWRRVKPEACEGPKSQDPVSTWFEGGGGRRLAKLVDLLSLELSASPGDAR